MKQRFDLIERFERCGQRRFMVSGEGEEKKRGVDGVVAMRQEAR